MSEARTTKRALALLGPLVLSCGVSTLVVSATAQSLTPRLASSHSSRPTPTAAAQGVVETTCVRCHNNRAMRGNLSLENFKVSLAADNAAVAEKMIRKLRTGMMPPPGGQRPAEADLLGIATSMEALIDARAEMNPNPGWRTFQRLNRAEYSRSIKALLRLDVDAAEYLPPDTKSANFDNIADVQLLSPTLMNSYLHAASEISRLAVGDPNATASEATFKVTRWVSQREQVEGAPYGTRGGLVVTHNFPADGDYIFRVSFHHETTGALYGSGRAALHTLEAPEQIEISVDGVRTATLEIDRWMHASDPGGVNLLTEPIAITAGPHRVAAAFIRRFEGPLQDLISPHEWSLASTSIADAYGFTSLPHLRDMAIRGPYAPTGISETPSRLKIFTCHPSLPSEELVCAQEVISTLATEAYRRPLTADNLDALMTLYEAGASQGDFETGVRMALEGILASPHFVFRFEEPPQTATTDTTVSDSFILNDLDLASRLSFFLWATGPDAELLRVATENRLSLSDELERQVHRMLADPRAETLSTRLAAQWLRLPDLEKIHPDVRTYPDFDEQLKLAMRRETELFFHNLVQEDRGLLELFTADYTFVNERLAEHYGIPDVRGDSFRRVSHVDSARHGILGHGSILTLTSHAIRTSPVLRGKWVMEVLLGSPPPPPPPNVPELEETAAAENGRLLSVRERMEVHRSNPACNSCHRMIDPIGLALENFDVTGAWRIKDNGAPIDATGQLYDGTPLTNPVDLREALVRRLRPLVGTFTENLMVYAIGRRLEYYDMPAVRRIGSLAAGQNYRISSFVVGVVNSQAFRMKNTSPTSQVEYLGGQP